MVDERMEQEIYLLYEKICQGIGDPKRILILYELSRAPRCVNDLADALGMPQSTTSRHLKVLRERSMVNAERDGASIIYSLADPRIIQALDIMRQILRAILQREATLAEFTALDNTNS